MLYRQHFPRKLSSLCTQTNVNQGDATFIKRRADPATPSLSSHSSAPSQTIIKSRAQYCGSISLGNWVRFTTYQLKSRQNHRAKSPPQITGAYIPERYNNHSKNVVGKKPTKITGAYIPERYNMHQQNPTLPSRQNHRAKSPPQITGAYIPERYNNHCKNVVGKKPTKITGAL